MKKYGLLIVLILVFLVIGLVFWLKSVTKEKALINNDIDKNTVTYNGWLHTDGWQIKNEKNEVIQLKGVSSHGLEWFPDCITYSNLEELKKDWKINTFRIAMYTDAGGSGYVVNPEKNIDKVCEIIDYAIKLDMYVIVDWHILSDNNPQIHQKEAMEFFDFISSKYSKNPNVIYEICNEPNGDNVTWNENVKPYAEQVIPVIRRNSENSLVIVGTPNWSKSITKPADDPLKFKNVVYSCHFYAGSHGEELRKNIDYCISKNIPIFISECGLTDASGNGAVYFEQFDRWIDYINKNKLSWIYWSFSYKDESSAILKPEYDTKVLKKENISAENNESNTTGESSEEDSFNNYLTNAGKYIKDIFKK